MSSPLALDGLDHVALYVSDLARSERWYTETLGLRRVHAEVWGRQPVMLVAGRSGVALFQARSPALTSPPPPAVPGTMSHLAFHVAPSAFASWRTALAARNLDVEFQDHQVTQSLYFRDPDGHQLEITTETSRGG
ncbi:MAG: VOC family protein [Verrucomicrobiales bacterium]|nr:VOC family protein [Verrucomicrobiales bacterium]